MNRDVYNKNCIFWTCYDGKNYYIQVQESNCFTYELYDIIVQSYINYFYKIQYNITPRTIMNFIRYMNRNLDIRLVYVTEEEFNKSNDKNYFDID